MLQQCIYTNILYVNAGWNEELFIHEIYYLCTSKYTYYNYDNGKYTSGVLRDW